MLCKFCFSDATVQAISADERSSFPVCTLHGGRLLGRGYDIAVLKRRGQHERDGHQDV